METEKNFLPNVDLSKNTSNPTTTPAINTSSLVDANSPTYWSYSVLGRRLLFRPIYRSGYKDAEDYYQQSYDANAGLRVAVALGGLMVFICIVAFNNRYGFFRKRRKLNVSLGNSQDQLEGIEWLRLMGYPGQNSLVYNPASSDPDLLKSQWAKPGLPFSVRSNIGLTQANGQFQMEPCSRQTASLEAIQVTVIALPWNKMRFSRSNSF
jgi:hypothetical protein